jgi:hypothetical protein
MGKKLQNKAETITIRVTEETKNRAESMYKLTGTSSTFASFLGDMVNLGINVKERLEAHIVAEIEKTVEDEISLETGKRLNSEEAQKVFGNIPLEDKEAK